MNANLHALNRTTLPLLSDARAHAESLRITAASVEGGGTLLDFGCRNRGGIAAGLLLAKICMANRAEVSLAPSDPQRTLHPLLSVYTDAPSLACMASQYAGWKISHGDFFAMGSGPMRAKRGKESVLDAMAIEDPSENAIGVLECDTLPGPEVVESVAKACGVAPSAVTLCVAPTTSLAGVLQVVARSIETSMHKLFELGFPLEQILSGHGTAPVPPIAKDAVSGIGRTNDAILYGGHVTLWVDGEESLIREIAPQVPSCASSDYGKPFAQTFKHYGYDFYKVDPGLFAPGMLTMINVRSGKSLRVGRFHPEVLQQSFGESTA